MRPAKKKASVSKEMQRKRSRERKKSSRDNFSDEQRECDRGKNRNVMAKIRESQTVAEKALEAFALYFMQCRGYILRARTQTSFTGPLQKFTHPLPFRDRYTSFSCYNLCDIP